MSDQPPEHPDPVVNDANQRIKTALEAFEQLNRTVREGEPGYGLPPTLDLTITLDTLASALVAKGLIDEADLVRAKAVKMAATVEAALESAREHKRSQTGLVVPGMAGAPAA